MIREDTMCENWTIKTLFKTIPQTLQQAYFKCVGGQRPLDVAKVNLTAVHLQLIRIIHLTDVSG